MIRPRLFILLIAALFLGACESTEEKAERYYQSAMRLLETGDQARAMVEFRNVFKYNGFHKDARKTYAQILMEQGDTSQAIRQYLRLIEQYPDMLEVRHLLAETAFDTRNWQEFVRHGGVAITLSPQAPRSIAIGLALEYRQATIDKDRPAQHKIAATAQELIATAADDRILVRLAVDYLASGATPLDALAVIEATLEHNNKQFDMHLMKFRVLSEQEDVAGTGDQLKLMFRLFPEREEIKAPLIGWYLAQDDLAGAEAFIREVAGDPAENPTAHIALVQFLLTTNGAETAKAELNGLIARTEGSPRNIYRRMAAIIDFEQGQADAAILSLHAMLDEGGAQNKTKSILAKILNAQGDQAEASVLVEDVLTEDPSNTDVLKLRANWAILRDETGAAIIDLRNALNQNPRDPDTLTLMALAYEREGNIDLAAERLALAVDVSGSAVKQSLNYANFLAAQGRISVANAVLIDSLQRSPQNLKLLTALAKSYLLQKDWARSQNIADRLRQVDIPIAQKTAQNLQATILMGQNRIQDSLAIFQQKISRDASDAENVHATILIVQTQIRLNRIDAARTFLDGQLIEHPDNLNLQLLSANIDALSGDLTTAEAAYKRLIISAPKSYLPVRMLLGVLLGGGRDSEVKSVLADALTRMPENRDLKWIKAELLEKAGDITGTIVVYEDLYNEDSSNLVVANNLASLLSTDHDDAAKVDRAYTIARRFRASEVPQFQDTYGWIAHLRGDPETALRHLETAAKALPDNPDILYHLGAVYAEAGRTEDAREHLNRAVKFFGNATTAQATEARKKLASLP